MKLQVGDVTVWCAVEICLYVPRKLNVKLWRQLEPPPGWRRKRYFAGDGEPVGFKPINPLTTPMLTRGQIEELHAKLCLILDREAA